MEGREQANNEKTKDRTNKVRKEGKEKTWWEGQSYERKYMIRKKKRERKTEERN